MRRAHDPIAKLITFVVVVLIGAGVVGSALLVLNLGEVIEWLGW